MRFTKRIFIAGLIFTVTLAACKKWDDHTAVENPDLNHDLATAIAANPDLSKFMEYVNKTGLDTLLRSSKTYTVWAPNNAALQTLDPAIVNDVVKLRSFVQNHISNQSYYTGNVQGTIRVPMLNGKFNNFSSTKFDEATITTADKFVKNGVLHVIDKMVPVLPSLWEYVNSTTPTYLQNAFIAGLNYNDFDPNAAIIDSISSSTGLPIYHPGTGVVLKNRFNDRVYDLKAEGRQFTYFVIQNPGFTLESDSLKNYYKATSTTITDSLSKFNTVKDLIVEGVYAPNQLTGLVSRSGVPIPINPALIVSTQKVSNGVVYVLSGLDVVTASKFKTINIEGEYPSGFMVDKPGNTNYRVRFNPVTGKDFTDLLVSGHGVTTFYSYYRLNEIPSIKYKVYAFAVNDFQTGTFTQNIVPKYFVAPSTYTTLATLAHAVPLYTATGAYNEVLLGEFTNNNFGTLEIQLTATATNPIVLDYMRLVPVP
jgi:uncharacterized surface protein with fasciclin (FAS1) repeats